MPPNPVKKSQRSVLAHGCHWWRALQTVLQPLEGYHKQHVVSGEGARAAKRMTHTNPAFDATVNGQDVDDANCPENGRDRDIVV